MNKPAKEGCLEKNIFWKKGDKLNSQVEVYSGLIPGYTVLFYQSGSEEANDLKIEIATDTLKLEYFLKYYEEIMKGLRIEAKSRRICRFNL